MTYLRPAKFCYGKWCGYEHACRVSWWPLDLDTYKHTHTHACTLFFFFARFQDINICLRGECELLKKVQNHFTLLPWRGYETLAVSTPSNVGYWLGQHCLIPCHWAQKVRSVGRKNYIWNLLSYENLSQNKQKEGKSGEWCNSSTREEKAGGPLTEAS